MTTDDLLRTAMTVDDELDEIKRARVWARLEPQLAEAIPSPRAHRSIAIGLALAAAAAAIIVIVHGHGTPASYIAPRDTTLSLHVDDHTRAVLVGPAQLDPIEQSPTTTVVRLRSGTLLAQFEGGHGRSLRIITAGAVVEIVGTVFAVEAMRDATCVSVSHGTVQMTSAGRVQTITTGERACSDELAMQPIAPAMRDALAHHETPTIAAAPARIAPIVTPIVTPLPPQPPTVVVPAATRPRIAAAPSRAIAEPAPARRAHTEIEARVDPPAPVAAVQPIAPLVAEPSTPVAPPAQAPAPSAPAPVPAPPIARPHVDADALYADAERELGARDVAAADRDLARLVAEFPTSSLIDQAYYERARIAFDRRAWAAAQRYLDKLAQLPASPLADPGAYLACRIAAEAHDAATAECFAEYRAKYSRSPHDQDALVAIVDLEFRAGGCARARAHVDELAKRYPASPFAAKWSATCR